MLELERGIRGLNVSKAVELEGFEVNGRIINPTTVTIRIDGEMNYLLEKHIFLYGGNKRDKCNELIKKQLLADN